MLTQTADFAALCSLLPLMLLTVQIKYKLTQCEVEYGKKGEHAYF